MTSTEIEPYNVLTAPFEAKCPPEVLTRAKKWLRSTRDNFSNAANFCIFGKTTASEKLGQWCHREMVAYLPYTVDTYTPEERECVATEIGAYRNVKAGFTPNVELYAPYVAWLTQTSFASRFILNRDDFDECLNYGIVLSSDIPTAVFQNILVMSRNVWEANPYAFEQFNKMGSAGIPGSAAYILTMGTTMSSWSRTQAAQAKPPTRTDQDLVYGYPSHRAWSCWSNPDSFKKFGNGEFGEPGNPHAKRHYREYADIYGGKQYVHDVQRTVFTKILCQDQEFADGLRSLRGESTKKSLITNPFKKKANPFTTEPEKQPHDVTVAEMHSYVLPFLKSKGYLDVSF